jgi:hypothetical protein
VACRYSPHRRPGNLSQNARQIRPLLHGRPLAEELQAGASPRLLTATGDLQDLPADFPC